MSKFILEAFIFPPRDKLLFFTQFVKKLNQFRTNIRNYTSELLTAPNKDTEEEKLYVVAGTIRQATDLKHDLYDLRNIIDQINSLKEDKILYLFQSAKQQKDPYYQRKYTVWLKEEFSSLVESFKSFIPVVDSMAEYNYQAAFSESYESYPEFKSAILTINKLLTEVQEMNKLIVYSFKKVERLSALINNLSDETLPDSGIESTETLYHTTVNAKTLLKTGFTTKFDQLKTEGIGGSNLDKNGNPSISFTSDIFVAKEILRCLKEAIMIAKGQLDFYEIKTWALQEGLDETISNHFVDFPEDKQSWTPDETFSYYRYYLALSKLRYDPLFVNTGDIMKTLSTKQPEDVGILVCTINMTDPAISYFQSMEEYRVPPGSVISIDKVLS